MQKIRGMDSVGSKQRDIGRAIGDLRRGDGVILHDAGSALLVHAAENLDERRLNTLRHHAMTLVTTPWRATAAGLSKPAVKEDAERALEFLLPLDIAIKTVHNLADPTLTSGSGLPPLAKARLEEPRGLAESAIELAKLAHLLPALVAARPDAAELARLSNADGILTIAVEDVLDYRAALARTLRPVAEARVPLADAENARIVAFRPEDGGPDHLAILVGEPIPPGPVLIRIHSECFTGDLLGSLRCDCGEQLRGAIRVMAEAGGGIVLYLAQEGRGIGLTNKLRAYTLQDAGLDTVDANLALGFGADERLYDPAVEILRQLGFGSVRLLTNNPEKIRALTQAGIHVVERVAHSFPANHYNHGYLATKAQRAGHLL